MTAIKPPRQPRALELGAVSFLNARPLIHELDRTPGIRLSTDVPSRLADRLADGAFDVALIPIIDVIRSGGRYAVVSDACIGCEAETMTVRVFSQRPPHTLTRLHVDGDSHTSVALARVIWRELFDRDLEIVPFADGARPESVESVLLIGDKVVNPARGSFAYEVDLGGAWREHTGLPFVFAVWAGAPRSGDADFSPAETQLLFEALGSARDRGVAIADRIATEQGPALGWTPPLATRYLTRCLRFTLDARMIEGVERFAELTGEAGASAPIRWPERLRLICSAEREE
ncbi:MAG: menaquinone biosynthesis protein [Phycisphaerales bacterium]|nr:menaquinone biosynthesis protein [Phycisphaerales bacterium]